MFTNRELEADDFSFESFDQVPRAPQFLFDLKFELVGVRVRVRSRVRSRGGRDDGEKVFGSVGDRSLHAQLLPHVLELFPRAARSVYVGELRGRGVREKKTRMRTPLWGERMRGEQRGNGPGHAAGERMKSSGHDRTRLDSEGRTCMRRGARERARETETETGFGRGRVERIGAFCGTWAKSFDTTENSNPFSRRLSFPVSTALLLAPNGTAHSPRLSGTSPTRATPPNASRGTGSRWPFFDPPRKKTFFARDPRTFSPTRRSAPPEGTVDRAFRTRRKLERQSS